MQAMGTNLTSLTAVLLLGLMPLLVLVAGEVSPASNSTIAQLEEDSPTSISFPFTEFSFPEKANLSSTANYTFPISKFDSTFNVSVTVDDESTSPGARLIVRVGICDRRKGRVLIKSWAVPGSSGGRPDYMTVEVQPVKLFPADLNCVYNASEPKLHIQLMRSADGGSGDITPIQSGTIAVRGKEMAATEVRPYKGSFSKCESTHSVHFQANTTHGHLLHLHEEVLLTPGGQSTYPIPMGAVTAEDIEIGVRKGKVEVWLASTDPICLAFAAVEGNGTTGNETGNVSETLFQDPPTLYRLLKIGEVKRGDRQWVPINLTLLEKFRKAERSKCGLEKVVQTALGAMSQKSREISEQANSVDWCWK